MALRFHEIAERNHRILNPFSQEKLMLLGEICRLKPGMNLLDLACGKGELLCQWASKYNTKGVGVDLSSVFLQAARERAHELNVEAQVTFVQDDAVHYPQEHHEYDVVSCLGATWIGNGLLGTLELMQQALKDHKGLLVVGEPFWYEEPPEHTYPLFDADKNTFTTLDGLLDRLSSAGVELVEMVLANYDDWDRYEAAQWMSVHRWLRDHPDDPDAAELKRWIATTRRVYMGYGRRFMGWGVFVLKTS